MEITRTAKSAKKMADLNVWHRTGCGVVHMSIGETVLNFSREEFSKFAESVVDIHCRGWYRTGEEHSVLDLISQTRDGEMGRNTAVH